MKYPKTQLKSGKIFEKPRTNIHGSSLKLEANAVAPVKRLQQKRPKERKIQEDTLPARVPAEWCPLL
ncbi:hypothetical protein NL676_023440 [Syzygium grande]|nr:hypothetical protein NL676_023440 [Syzygium grande]